MSQHRKHLHPPSPTEAESFGAPWMKWALEELGKKVAEHDSASEYKRNLYHALSANNPHGPALLDWNKVNREFASRATDAAGPTLMAVAKSRGEEIPGDCQDRSCS